MADRVSGEELWRWRQQAQRQAIAADVPVAELDWLLQEVVGCDRLSLRLESFKNQSQIALRVPLADLTQLWQQRVSARVPVQYLAGSTAWRNFVLRVSPAVLIPRPETEEIIELAIELAKQSALPGLQQGHWADLGTGSGAIALGLAEAFPEAIVHASDRSSAALAIAQHNAEQLGLESRIRFYQGDWFEPIAILRDNLTSMVSNPPYIPSHFIAELQPEVSHHEPHLALDGGTDGLDCIRHLVSAAPLYLRSGGIWLIEMMQGQADAVVQLLVSQGSYRQIQVHADLSGIDRFVSATRI